MPACPPHMADKAWRVLEKEAIMARERALGAHIDARAVPEEKLGDLLVAARARALERRRAVGAGCTIVR